MREDNAQMSTEKTAHDGNCILMTLESNGYSNLIKQCSGGQRKMWHRDPNVHRNKGVLQKLCKYQETGHIVRNEEMGVGQQCNIYSKNTTNITCEGIEKLSLTGNIKERKARQTASKELNAFVGRYDWAMKISVGKRARFTLTKISGCCGESWPPTWHIKQ